MIEIKIEWTEKNIEDYIKYAFKGGKKSGKVAIIAASACYLAILAVCLYGYFALDYGFLLPLAVIMTVLLAAFAAFMVFMTKHFTKSAIRSNINSEFNSVILNDIEIIVCKDGAPFGSLSWDKIGAVSFNDEAQAAYLSVEENSVLILEYKNIVSGTKEEMLEILGRKNDKLSEKA